jgi:hypothetical protein
MTEAEYRALNAVNYSNLKHMRKSPKHYKHNLDNPDQNDNKYAELRAIHAMLLEPFAFDDNFAVYDGRRDKRVKEYQDFLATAGTRNIITPAEKARAQILADAYRANDMVEMLLSDPGTSYEVNMVWADPETGLQCKGRGDVINITRREEDGWVFLTVADIKTFYTTDPRQVARDARKNGWFLQLAHYAEGAVHQFQLDPKKLTVRWFSIIAEQDAPHDCSMIEWGSRVQSEARAELRHLLGELKACTDADSWPGRGAFLDFDEMNTYIPSESAESAEESQS